VYEAFELPPPIYVTVPPILAKSGSNKKLGKRDGAKDILDYQKEGYLPEAMLNFLALLGWNPGGEKEIFTVEELIKIFSLDRIQISGAQMNMDKLDWINKEHIKLLPSEEVEKNILEWLPEDMRNKKLVPVIAERISKWGDVAAMAESGELDFFIKTPSIDKEKLVYKNSTLEKTTNNLKIIIDALEKIDEENFNTSNIIDTLMLIAEASGSRGEVLHPVRYALSGRDKSPDPFIIASILGKDETILRLQNAI
jgi:glutamyl/glutaminyl-tRNA synthetase